MINKIKELMKKLRANQVVSGSFVMVVGGFVISLTNYLFHLITARSLGPKDYGILDSLISLVAQLTIPLTVISTVIIKYVSFFKGQNRMATIESFFWKINKKLLIITLPFPLVMLIITPLVTYFLRLPSPLLFIWIELYFVIGIFSTLAKSFAQGLCRFTGLTIVGIIEGIFRLVLTVILISLGWGLFGAIFPLLAMVILSLGLTWFLVRDILNGRKTEPIHEKKEILTFIFPVLFTNLGITSLITSDVILARYFFPEELAGYYAALSTLGKIIYFAAVPIVGVIFPLVSEAQAAKEDLTKIIMMGFSLVGLIVGACLLVFAFLPQTMITILFGGKYLFIEPYVFSFGVAMSLYTFDVVLLNIFLAMKKVLPTLLVCLATVIRIMLIILFHQSIFQMVNFFVVVSALLLGLLLLYFIRCEKN